MLAQKPYEYDLGDLVQLAPNGRAYQVTWRGQLLVRVPGGFVRRVAVYRLDDGHWDCYYDDEFQSFGRWY